MTKAFSIKRVRTSKVPAYMQMLVIMTEVTSGKVLRKQVNQNAVNTTAAVN